MRKLILLLFFTQFAFAQQAVDLSYYLPQNVQYDPKIPTPESVLGYQVGQWHVTHDQLVNYMKVLDAASDRISLENRGTTYEDRPLILLTITAPKNHQNIEQIRQQHLQLTEPSGSSLDVSTMPLVLYQGFSIHGNEPSGSNASLLVAYYLAAAQGPEIESLLDHTVILFDPSFNPDGLQRFSYWANTNKSKNINPDPNDREYREVWPGGRTNHYWFDMNRDWLPTELPESQVRITTYRNWMPNILTDHHEMGTESTFFFQPGIPSRTHPITPKLNQELTAEIGAFHAKALDKIGSLYYTEESYDDFYYGKGSTYPDVNGGIGILFEQASSRGHAQQTSSGVLTFAFTIRNQFTAALSTLEAAQNMRAKILNYQRDFFAENRSLAAKDKMKTFVFGDSKDASKTIELAKVLLRHQIKVNEISGDFSAEGKSFKKGYAFAVPTNQKNYRLIQAIFEDRTQFQDSLFYDISAWSFKHAFDVDYASLNTTSQLGAEVSSLELPTGHVDAKSNYAYLMEWHEYYSPKALNKLLENGLVVKVGLKKFTASGRQFDYGSLMIPAQNQRLNTDQIYALLQQVASESHTTFYGVDTGMTPSGIDLGSRFFANIGSKKVALLVGDGVDSHDAGEIWHVFDQRYDMKITKLDTRNFNRVNLWDYTTFIVPNIQGKVFSEDQSKTIERWVKDGGTLIAYQDAINWLNSSKLMEVEFVKEPIVAKKINFEQKDDFFGAQRIYGAIFEAKLDRSNPINFGYKDDKLALFRNTNIFIKADKESYNNPVQYTANPLLSGYISKENLTLLKNTVPVKIKKSGKGQIIAFTDNTNFRAFWFGTNKLMMNAVFFGPEL
ncbi:MAG: M14 metallopeptidase family protein [Flavobacteriaceae bacterium]|nr:M14 metallopeptidase family protein [Flavobacteriaceae bacterium]